MVEIHLQRLKIFFLRTTGRFSTNFGTKHSSMKGDQGFTNKDHSFLKKKNDIKWGFSSPNQ